MKHLNSILILITVMAFFCKLNAQIDKLNLDQQMHIDSYFSEWENKELPGVAAAIISEGEVIMSKGYGLANITHKKSIDQNSVFQISELSKQFVALSILKLESESKLNMNDPIHKFIPELKQFKFPILVKHLLNNTSGLNDYWTVKFLAGWREEDLFTSSDVFNLINNQEQLVFKPGTDFLVSYSNIALLVKIIEKVTSQSLSEYTTDQIFKPLHMLDTKFTIQPNELNNLSLPYRQNSNGDLIRLYSNNNQVMGSISCFSSLNDMAIWFSQAHQSESLFKSLIIKLNSFAKADDGRMFTPSSGKLTLGQQYMHAERGINKIWQHGSTNGYAAGVFYFPSKQLTTFVLGNNGLYYNAYLAMQMAGYLLEDQFTEPAFTDYSKMNLPEVKAEILQSYSGYYWNEKSFISREIKFENDTLWYIRSPQMKNALIPLSQNKFQMLLPTEDKIYFTFENVDGSFQYTLNNGESDPSTSVRYEKQELTKADLEQLQGIYINKGHHIIYEIKLDQDLLIASHKKNGSIALAPVKDLIFEAGPRFLYGIQFEKKDKGISGFYATGYNMRNIYFEKFK